MDEAFFFRQRFILVPYGHLTYNVLNLCQYIPVIFGILHRIGGDHMRNRLIATLLTLSMLLSILPPTAFAAEEGPNITIDDKLVVEDGKAIESLPAGVDYTRGTLTLDKASLINLHIHGGDDVTIVLRGESTVQDDGTIVDEDGNLREPVMLGNTTVTIKGPGSLIATASSSEGRAFVADYTDLTITDGATVTAQVIEDKAEHHGSFESVSGSLTVEGGATLNVLGLGGLGLTENGTGSGSLAYSFKDCTINANCLWMTSDLEDKTHQVTVGPDAVLNLSAKKNIDADTAGNVLQILDGSHFILDGGQVTIDTTEASNGDQAAVLIQGKNSLLDLRSGSFDADIAGSHSIQLDDNAALIQTGGTLSAQVSGSSYALLVSNGNVTLKGGSTGFTGGYGVLLESRLDSSSMTINGGFANITSTKGDTLSIRSGGKFTMLDGSVTLESSSGLPLYCEGGSTNLLGGAVYLENANGHIALSAKSKDQVIIGSGMYVLDNNTGKEITMTGNKEGQFLSPSVTISGEKSLGAYDCDLSIPSGQITQGARFTVRAIVSLGAPKGEVTFALPAGVSYVPGSLTVDSRSVSPTSTDPLTVPLQEGGTIRFSAIARDSGGKDLTAVTTAGNQKYQEKLNFDVSAFNLSLPSRTCRLELPVSGSAVPNGSIVFYEGTRSLGRASVNALGTWSGTVTLPEVEGEHTVHAVLTLMDGSTIRSEDHIVTYEPEADEVKTLTITNYIHGRTDLDPPIEETLVIDYVNGEDSSDYYSFWPDLPTLSFRVDFVKDSSAQSQVTVVTTNRNGQETKVPLRYKAAEDAWFGSYDFDDESVPYKFRVEYVSGTPSEGIELEGEFAYDENGNLIRGVYDDGVVYFYTYDSNNKLKQASSGDFTYYYDKQSRIAKAENSNGIIATLDYDNSGNIKKISFNEEDPLIYTYNKDGKTTKVTQGKNTYHFNDNQQVISIINKDGTTTISYNADGCISKVTYPDGTYSQYSYDSNRQMSSVTDGTNTYYFRYNGDMTFMRDDEGTEISWSPSSIPVEQYFDLKDAYTTGELHVRTQDGDSISYIIDKESLTITSTTPKEQTYIYVYNKNGDLISVTENNQTTKFSYDNAGNLTKITYPDGKSITYQYDKKNQLVQVIDNEGYQTGYVYDSRGRITGLTDGSNECVTYQYNSDDTLARVDNANGTYTTYAYTGGNVSSIKHHDKDDNLLSSFVYTYDRAGNVTSMTDTEGTWTYAYDKDGQLIKATTPDGRITTYAYDAAGNRTQVSYNGQTVSYTSNIDNQYTTYGNTTRTYDATGNLLTETCEGKTARYTWNDNGQLIAYVDFSGTKYEYGYDLFGLRNKVTVNGKTTSFLNDPLGYGMPIASYNSSGDLHYMLTSTIAATRSGNSTYYYNANLIGSVTEITGDSGSVVNRYTYDQEGNVVTKTEGINNLFSYAGLFGLVNDENGLIYNRSRYVSIDSDSFISKDPAGDLYDDNLYRYVGNNPVNILDVNGMMSIGIGRLKNIVLKNQVPVKVNLTPNIAENVNHMNNAAMQGWLFGLSDILSEKAKKYWIGSLLAVLFVRGSLPGYSSPLEDLPPPPDTPSRPPDTPLDSDDNLPPFMRALENPVAEAFSWSPYPWMYPPVLAAAYVAEKWPSNPLTKLGGSIGNIVGGLLYPEPEIDPKLYPYLIAPYDPFDPESNPQLKGSTPDRPITVNLDPSGYVYEGIESNRLSGVTTTLYYSNSTTQPTGNASESQKWDASKFEQSNPLTTDAMGQYLWMVPDGWWQVKYQKNGYSTVYSDWLPVPPIQTDVNVGLISKEPAQLTLSGEAGDKVIVLRFDRPVRLDSVSAQTIQLSHSGTTLSGTFIPVDPAEADDGQQCATTFSFQLSGGQTLKDGSNLTAKYNNIITYAGASSNGSASATVVDLMPFSDVGKGDYFYDSIFWAINAEPQITNGTGKTTFSPNQGCTRGQAVTFLWRAMGEPEPESTTNPFTDVSAGSYYYKAVLWAVENGITNGTSKTTFSPNATCTRGQIVTFLHRTENSPEPLSETNPFRDVRTSDYFFDAVLWAGDWGITKGTSATAFSPNATCTRGQIVTFLYRDMK